MLTTMLDAGEKDLGQDTAQTALVAHCLAMLWYLGGDRLKVRAHCFIYARGFQRFLAKEDPLEMKQGSPLYVV